VALAAIPAEAHGLVGSMRPGSGWFLLFNHFDDFVLVSNGKKLGINVSDFLCS